VVASDIPGNRLAINSGEHGLLVPPVDVEALAAGIDDLLSHPDRAAALGAAGRARVSREFSLGKMVQQHLDLFEQLLSKHSS
jgi:glycosyltransferase involved in cell wall biosynthesis